MTEDGRRRFLTGAVAATVTPLIPPAQAGALGESESSATPRDPPSAFPDFPACAIAVTGDLRRDPVFLTNLRRGVLSDPFELEGNGTYRLRVSPVEDHPVGPVFNVVLADEQGNELAQMNIGTNGATLFRQCGMAIFGRYGVMIYVAHI
jgi:hypothetical protein